MLDMINKPSPNCEPRLPGQAIDMLVLHYTGMPTMAEALERLCDPAAKVSAHYLIDQDGRIFQLVAEDQRAWHAGVSCWRGDTDVNGRSIGIELVNKGHDWGYHPFPEEQIAALETVCRGILARHAIPARNVVGHSDVAPRRKQDPGELFPWKRLADAGIGLWPKVRRQGLGAPELLMQYGYDVSDPRAAICAFQLHFRPNRIDGYLDEECLGLLAGLNALI